MGGDLDLPELLRGAIMHEVRTPTMVDPESDTGKKNLEEGCIPCPGGLLLWDLGRVFIMADGSPYSEMWR